LIAIFLLISAPSALASETTFFAMKPDKEFCFSVTFGQNGRGEYTFTMSDPEYPRRGWVDNHRTSFTSGPDNPVIIPVCFSTRNRRVGDYVLLRSTLETPEGITTHDYGICVSRNEDADVVESDRNPCETTSLYTDLFSIGFVESEKFSAPGQKVAFTLLVSSEFDAQIILDKESGPAMEIGVTTVQMPGQQSVGISMDAPSQAGDYPFTLKAKVSGCNQTSCVKSVTGILHVAQPSNLEGFRVELAPQNKNIVGTQTATFSLTVRNLDAQQIFSISIDMPSQLNTDFKPLQASIGRGASRTIEFSVAPASTERNLYMIKAVVEDSKGDKKVTESYLTVEEAAGDAQRVAETVPKFQEDANSYEGKYDTSPTINDWKDVNDAADAAIKGGKSVEGQPASPLNWVFILLAAVGISLVVFFIYRKTHVYQEVQMPNYRY